MAFNLIWRLLPLVLLSFVCPKVGKGACGKIPGTFPVYSSSEIELKENIKINGNTVVKQKIQPNASIAIDGSTSTSRTQTFPSLDPATFPTNNSNLDKTIKSSLTFDSTTTVFFKKIQLDRKGIIVNVTGGGPFNIDTLEIKKDNITLNLEAGVYFIKKLSIKGKNFRLNTSSAPVVLHIGKEFKMDKKNVTINQGGSVDSLRVYLHSGAKFESEGKNLDFTGFIYGPKKVDKVSIKKNASFHGAIIISGKKIEIEDKNVKFTYTRADQAAVNLVSTCQGGGGGGGDTIAENFNCVETGANPVSGLIFTKLTGQNFTLDIIALKKNGSVENKFAKGQDHTLTMELVDASGGASCDTLTALLPAVTQNLTFTAADSGSKTSATLSVNRAYRVVRCRVTDSTDPLNPVSGCSADAFAVRPAALTITSNMTNSGPSGAPKAKAGDPFTLSAAALPGYDGAPSIDATKIQDHNGILRNSAVAGSFNTANAASGIATGNGFNYAEVGLFRFLGQGVYDDSFTTIDQPGDCTAGFANTPDGSGRIGCNFGNTTPSAFFGRFTPDHFDVSLNTPEFAPGCGSFTYIGQPVKYNTQPIASFSAKNAAGNVTGNYHGSYWKIAITDLTYGITPSYSAAGHTLTVVATSPPSATENGDGTGQLIFADTASDILSVVRNAPENTFDAEIALFFNLQDTDGIAVANVNGSPQANPVNFGSASSGSGIAFAGGNKQQRWGRLNIGNAHGSELLDLPVPLYAEYFDGTNFIGNTADNCTSLTLAGDLLLSNPETSSGANQIGTTIMTIGTGNSSAALVNSPLLSGSAGLSFSAPGVGNTGYIDITGNFATLPWLLYDWNKDSIHDDNPRGKVTFGVYKGNSRQIYFREVY